MENTVADKESPIPSIHEGTERSTTTLLLDSFGSSDGRTQIHVKDILLDSDGKLLFAQQQSHSANNIHFITHPTTQDASIDPSQIQLADLQSGDTLHPTTTEATTIHIAQNKDDILYPFQFPERIRLDFLDLRTVSAKSIEDEQRTKFVSQKLKSLKTIIDELYKKAGITTVALTAFDGNVQFSGPDHMKMLEENMMLKTIFLNAVISNEGSSISNRKSDRNKPGSNSKSTNHQWPCDECSRAFSSKCNLDNHKLLSHSDLPVHKCEICQKEYVDESIFQKHLMTHRETNSFRCKICGSSFAGKNVLNSHMKIHVNDKAYQCKICSKSFGSASSLRYHTSKHNENSKCVCSYCNKEFTKMSSLKVHMRIHSGEQPYKCQECGKGFVVSTHLTRHLRVHSGEKPYLCEVCGKRFNRSSHLRIHYRIHSGEKPYECEICGKRFNQTVSKKKHLRTHANK